MIAITYVLVGIFGLVFGSFLNVLIYRLPNEQSLVSPGSHCPKCNAPIKWYDNIPVLSYLVLCGKCRHCKAKISPQYILVEIINMLLWLACAVMFWGGDSIFAVIAMMVCSLLLCIFFIDIEHKIIPDSLTFSILALGIIAIFFQPHISFLDCLLGFGIALVFYLSIYFIGKLMFRREAMGIGDIKLMAVAGLFLGWKGIIVAIILSSIIACICLLFCNLVYKKHEREIPFAPYLTVGIVVSMLFSEVIVDWYLGLFI